MEYAAPEIQIIVFDSVEIITTSNELPPENY